jgi:hypothetical protein
MYNLLCSCPYLYQFAGLLMRVNRETIEDHSVGEPTKVILLVYYERGVRSAKNRCWHKRMLIFSLKVTRE